jgi:stearoyl-CoA desaturase (delta-9 desaturase)
LFFAKATFALAPRAAWQLNCELVRLHPPVIRIEPRISEDRFYRFLERTWMVQQLSVAFLLYAAGGWGFVWWAPVTPTQ